MKISQGESDGEILCCAPSVAFETHSNCSSIQVCFKLQYVYMKKEREENPRVFALLRFYSVTLGGLIERGPTRSLKGVSFKRNWGAALVGSITR